MKKPIEYDTPLDRDAADLHRALTDLIRVYQFRDRRRICCHDISVTQCYALDVLAGRGPVLLRALADALYLDNSTTSRVVDSLERKGYARRTRDPGDGRAVQIEVTAAGRSLFEQIERTLVDEQKKLIADIDPEVRRATAMLVARLARASHDRFSGACGVDLNE